MTRTGKKLLGAAANALSLPERIIPGTTEVYVVGNGKLWITAHRGIVRAEKNSVGFKCDGYCIYIDGGPFILDAVSANEAHLTGRIENIAFRGAGGGSK